MQAGAIQGKRVVVTGGSRGIGYAIAKMFATEGARVAICARGEAGVREAIERLREQTGALVYGTACDVRDAEAVRKFFAYVDDVLGSLNILVNNAGIGVFLPVAQMSVEQWRQTLETNLNGVFYCCRLALERFLKSGGGDIVNISSLAGKNAFAGGAAYNASKFGLEGFSEALMLDHRMDGVRVTTVMPGSVATNFGRTGKQDWMIQPEDVAEVVRMVVTMPERTMVSRVELRPSRPRK